MNKFRFIFVDIKKNRPSARMLSDVENAAKQRFCLSGARFAERIVDPLAILARADQPGVQQDAHVMGERRLADAQRLLKAACAALARLQKREDRETVLIAQGLEHTRCHLVGLVHDTTL